jgi:hypothetical protein
MEPLGQRAPGPANRKQDIALQLMAAGFILAALPVFLGGTPVADALGALYPLGILVAIVGAAVYLFSASRRLPESPAAPSPPADPASRNPR